MLLVLVAGAFALRLAWVTLPDAEARQEDQSAEEQPLESRLQDTGRARNSGDSRSQGRSSSRALERTPNTVMATSSSPAARPRDLSLICRTGQLRYVPKVERDKRCSRVCRLRRWVQPLVGKVDGRSGRMRAGIDSGLYIDDGLLSGLEAMSEMRELLDVLYGDEALPEIPSEE